MARKRMFDSEIINQDKFLDLPNEAKALYFLLGMEADDEGFVAPKRVTRLHGISEDNLKILIMKEFVIPFDTGVVVITDWKRNNYLDKNRIAKTIYQEELSLLTIDENQKYALKLVIPSVKQMLNESLTDVKPMLNQYSIEENSIEENSKESKKESKKTFNELIENYTKNTELQNELKEHLKTRKSKKATLTNRAIELSLRKLDELCKDVSDDLKDEEKIEIVQQSIQNGWTGFFELKDKHRHDDYNWDFDTL